MRYQDVRQHISNGDFFLFRGKGLFSRLIRWRTESVYSHVGVALWVDAGEKPPRLAILEALEPHGVRLYPFSRYLEECSRRGVGVDWFKLDDTLVDRHAVASYVLEQWGKKYAVGQLVVSFGVISTLWRRLTHTAVPLVDGEDRFFCSELGTAAIEHGARTPAALDGSQLPAATDPGSLALLPCLRRMGTLTT